MPISPYTSLGCGCSNSVSPSDIALLDGHILIGNSLNVAQDRALTGDIAITDTGVSSYNGLVPVAKSGNGWSNAQTDSNLTGTQNNFIAATGFIYFTNAGGITLTGITAPSPVDNREIILFAGTTTVTLLNESASSTTGNRLTLPNAQNMTILLGTGLRLKYNTTTSRWRIAEFFKLPQGTNNQITVTNISNTAIISLPSTVDITSLQVSSILNSSGDLQYDVDSNVLYDFGGSQSIDTNIRNLFDSVASPSLDYDLRNLLNTGGLITLDWELQLLNDQYSGTIALDWGNRFLYNASNFPVIDFANCFLNDGAGTQSADWSGRYLYYADGVTPVLNWNGGQLLDSSGVISGSWFGRGLYDSSGGDSINYNDRYLLSSPGQISVDWSGQSLKTGGNDILIWSSGYVIAKGTNTNNAAGAGIIGESTSASISQASATTLTTATAKTVTSISLTAGDWDVCGVIMLTGGAVTGTIFEGGISTTTNSFTGSTLGISRVQSGALATATSDSTLSIPSFRVSLSATTTYYLIASSTFTVGTAKAYGSIYARRMR